MSIKGYRLQDGRNHAWAGAGYWSRCEPAVESIVARELEKMNDFTAHLIQGE